MLSLRRSVFETNSSSTHAIMICKNPVQGKSERWTLEEGFEQLRGMGAKVVSDSYSTSIDFGPMDPKLADFGRTEEAYNTFGMKLLYAIVSFKNDEFLWGALMHFLSKKEISEIYLKVKYTQFRPKGETLGYVDHDSTEALAKIFGNGMSFEDYLFRKDVFLVIDNEG